MLIRNKASHCIFLYLPSLIWTEEGYRESSWLVVMWLLYLTGWNLFELWLHLLYTSGLLMKFVARSELVAVIIQCFKTWLCRPNITGPAQLYLWCWHNPKQNNLLYITLWSISFSILRNCLETVMNQIVLCGMHVSLNVHKHKRRRVLLYRAC